jgi:hypothetical protein
LWDEGFFVFSGDSRLTRNRETASPTSIINGQNKEIAMQRIIRNIGKVVRLIGVRFGQLLASQPQLQPVPVRRQTRR